MTQTIAERLREIADSNERSAFDLQGREAQENPVIRALAWKLQSDCATLRGIAAELDAKANLGADRE